MPDIADLAKESLAYLNADERYVSGAVLGNQIARRARQQGVAYKDALSASGLTLLQYLQLQSDFEIIERPDTDFLIRLRTLPTSAIARGDIDGVKPARRHLREDVYDAFTRVNKPFVYLRSADRFVPSKDAPDSIDSVSVPEATLDILVNDRMLFADTLPSNVRDSVSRVLSGQYALRDFKAILPASYFEKWIAFHNQVLTSRISEWAASKDLSFPESWFQGMVQPQALDIRPALKHIITEMTDDDLDRLLIPAKYLRLYLRR